MTPKVPSRDGICCLCGMLRSVRSITVKCLFLALMVVYVCICIFWLIICFVYFTVLPNAILLEDVFAASPWRIMDSMEDWRIDQTCKGMQNEGVCIYICVLDEIKKKVS